MACRGSTGSFFPRLHYCDKIRWKFHTLCLVHISAKTWWNSADSALVWWKSLINLQPLCEVLYSVTFTCFKLLTMIGMELETITITPQGTCVHTLQIVCNGKGIVSNFHLKMCTYRVYFRGTSGCPSPPPPFTVGFPHLPHRPPPPLNFVTKHLAHLEQNPGS